MKRLIIGPLPRTSKGFEYILVLQDLCTRWVEASPIRKVKVKTVVGELNRKIFLRFDCPEVFASDYGTAFTNHVVVDFLRERGVHHTHTRPYRIQVTRVECAHRTFKAMVAPYLKKWHTTWDEKLQELHFDMNTAVQTSTGMSPALSLYGRQPEPPGTQRRLQCIDVETPKEERGKPLRAIARYCPIYGRYGERDSRRCPDRAQHLPKRKKLASQ